MGKEVSFSEAFKVVYTQMLYLYLYSKPLRGRWLFNFASESSENCMYSLGPSRCFMHLWPPAGRTCELECNHPIITHTLLDLCGCLRASHGGVHSFIASCEQVSKKYLQQARYVAEGKPKYWPVQDGFYLQRTYNYGWEEGVHRMF